MGDVIHCLPAITDLSQNLPEAEIHWVVEEGFVDIARLHPAVARVIPIAIRRWRKSWLGHRAEIAAFRRSLRAEQYDLVLDAQGLIKSAIVAIIAGGPIAGFNRESAREPLAAKFYQRQLGVEKDLHAILRLRKLFGRALDYEPATQVSYGLSSEASEPTRPTVLFFHGTTWASKHYPVPYWVELARICQERGFTVKLPGVSVDEQRRAAWLAKHVSAAEIIPPGSLSDLVAELRRSSGVVSVDTGLGHLATALNIPLVGVYGPTSPTLTGFHGPRQVSMSEPALACAPCIKAECQYKKQDYLDKIYPPCFNELTADHVFQQLEVQLNLT